MPPKPRTPGAAGRGGPAGLEQRLQRHRDAARARTRRWQRDEDVDARRPAFRELPTVPYTWYEVLHDESEASRQAPTERAALLRAMQWEQDACEEATDLLLGEQPAPAALWALPLHVGDVAFDRAQDSETLAREARSLAAALRAHPVPPCPAESWAPRHEAWRAWAPVLRVLAHWHVRAQDVVRAHCDPGWAAEVQQRAPFAFVDGHGYTNKETAEDAMETDDPLRTLQRQLLQGYALRASVAELPAGVRVFALAHRGTLPWQLDRLALPVVLLPREALFEGADWHLFHGGVHHQPTDDYVQRGLRPDGVLELDELPDQYVPLRAAPWRDRPRDGSFGVPAWAERAADPAPRYHLRDEPPLGAPPALLRLPGVCVSAAEMLAACAPLVRAHAHLALEVLHRTADAGRALLFALVLERHRRRVAAEPPVKTSAVWNSQQMLRKHPNRRFTRVRVPTKLSPAERRRYTPGSEFWMARPPPAAADRDTPPWTVHTVLSDDRRGPPVVGGEDAALATWCHAARLAADGAPAEKETPYAAWHRRAAADPGLRAQLTDEWLALGCRAADVRADDAQPAPPATLHRRWAALRDAGPMGAWTFHAQLEAGGYGMQEAAGAQPPYPAQWKRRLALDGLQSFDALERHEQAWWRWARAGGAVRGQWQPDRLRTWLEHGPGRSELHADAVWTRRSASGALQPTQRRTELMARHVLLAAPGATEQWPLLDQTPELAVVGANQALLGPALAGALQANAGVEHSAAPFPPSRHDYSAAHRRLDVDETNACTRLRLGSVRHWRRMARTCADDEHEWLAWQQALERWDAFHAQWLRECARQGQRALVPADLAHGPREPPLPRRLLPPRPRWRPRNLDAGASLPVVQDVQTASQVADAERPWTTGGVVERDDECRWFLVLAAAEGLRAAERHVCQAAERTQQHMDAWLQHLMETGAQFASVDFEDWATVPEVARSALAHLRHHEWRQAEVWRNVAHWQRVSWPFMMDVQRRLEVVRTWYAMQDQARRTAADAESVRQTLAAVSLVEDDDDDEQAQRRMDAAALKHARDRVRARAAYLPSAALSDREREGRRIAWSAARPDRTQIDVQRLARIRAQDRERKRRQRARGRDSEM